MPRARSRACRREPPIVSSGVRFRISYTGGDGNDVTLTVDGPPSIGPLTDLTILENHTLGPIDFTVADDFTAAAGCSSRPLRRTPNWCRTQITLAGTGSTRTLTITPAAFVSGTATITVTASDGVFTTQRSFLLTVTPPRATCSRKARPARSSTPTC